MKNFRLIKDGIIVGRYSFPTMSGTGLPIVIDAACKLIKTNFTVKDVGCQEYTLQKNSVDGIVNEAKFVDENNCVYILQEMNGTLEK